VARFVALGRRTGSCNGNGWQSHRDDGDEDCADCALCNVAELPVLWSFGVRVFGVASIFSIFIACEKYSKLSKHIKASTEHGT